MWSIRYTIIFHTFIDLDSDSLNEELAGTETYYHKRVECYSRFDLHFTFYAFVGSFQGFPSGKICLKHA